ncbi:MAG TPA: PAS domain S-box protein, partial [Candidatus Limnocylindrales bacterium]|nr:PAS domain S-box protein [Candidatus Limnocylindrales bacterium]
LGTFAARPAAFDEAATALVRALADHAGQAIANEALIAELARSRRATARRASAERALREGAARLAATLDPRAVLQQTVDAAVRVLRADAALIDLVDPETGRLRGAYETGLGRFLGEDRPASREGAPGLLGATESLGVGEGLSGRAVAARRVFVTGDYLVDRSFIHAPSADRFIRRSGIRSLIAAPLIGDGGPLGALEVYSVRPNAFDAQDAALAAALANQAATALTTAGLVDELRRSRAQLVRRVDTERALQEIVAAITEIRPPDEILQTIVDAARRLLGSDGGYLTLLDDAGQPVTPVVVAGTPDPAGGDPSSDLERAIATEIGRLAIATGGVVATEDWSRDPRIERPDDALARRLGLRAVAVAPLRASGGRVVGTLAVSHARSHRFDAEELALLQRLADHAAVAVTNSRLYERLRESEARYRFLVDNSPDVIWQYDETGRFTFLSETVERALGWRAEEMVGRYYSEFTPPESQAAARALLEAIVAEPNREHVVRLVLARRDGRRVPFEMHIVARLIDGRFAGAQGVSRDVTERDRLERELRASEERYRLLVQSSPDVIFATDGDGRYTFMSERVEQVLGWTPKEMIGRPFLDFVPPESLPAAIASYRTVVAEPAALHEVRLHFRRRDGGSIPLDVRVVGEAEDGRLVAVRGVARDVSERERLERELRESEERYRFLVENSPDVVFSTDASGRVTYISETIERLTGYRPDELIGRHFEAIVDRTGPDGASRWDRVAADPSRPLTAEIRLRHRDGTLVPAEVSAIGITVDGRFAGVHGAARDVSERVRLEQDLRRQAAELAASEERAHLARELHDSVTQALFSMTLVTRSLELVIGRDPAAAAEKLALLRELQRDALAEMRSLIFELRPGSLERDGLVEALRRHVAAIEGRIGLPVVLEADLPARLPLPVEEALYRIAQEALHNVVKHAGPAQVRVTVRGDGTSARLVVADDGAGFDPSAVGEGHYGLAGMRARAERVGGRLAVEARPGGGTRVSVTVPASGASPATG